MACYSISPISSFICSLGGLELARAGNPPDIFMRSFPNKPSDFVPMRPTSAFPAIPNQSAELNKFSLVQPAPALPRYGCVTVPQVGVNLKSYPPRSFTLFSLFL